MNVAGLGAFCSAFIGIGRRRQAVLKMLVSHLFTECKTEMKHLAVLHSRLDSLKCIFKTINRKHFGLKWILLIRGLAGVSICLSILPQRQHCYV